MTAQPPPGPDGPDRKGTQFNLATTIAIAVAAFVVAGAIGYFVGDSAGEDSGKEKGKAELAANYQPGEPGYERIYAAGRKDGVTAGRAKGRKQGEREGKKRGEAEGKQAGLQEGRTEGEKSGESKGFSQGASAALGNMSGWAPGTFYIVQVGAANGLETSVTQRQAMDGAYNYKLCNQEPTKVCRSPKPAR